MGGTTTTATPTVMAVPNTNPCLAFCHNICRFTFLAFFKSDLLLGLDFFKLIYTKHIVCSFLREIYTHNLLGWLTTNWASRPTV
jgi:hypothetical protein